MSNLLMPFLFLEPRPSNLAPLRDTRTDACCRAGDIAMQTTTNPRRRGPRRAAVTLKLGLLCLILVSGCAGHVARQAADDGAAVTGDGPTLYGELGVSVDHVSTR
jgi:hypothetical protein